LKQIKIKTYKMKELTWLWLQIEQWQFNRGRLWKYWILIWKKEQLRESGKLNKRKYRMKKMQFRVSYNNFLQINKFLLKEFILNNSKSWIRNNLVRINNSFNSLIYLTRYNKICRNTILFSRRVRENKE
jgi:hypothetical protein